MNREKLRERVRHLRASAEEYQRNESMIAFDIQLLQPKLDDARRKHTQCTAAADELECLLDEVVE